VRTPWLVTVSLVAVVCAAPLVAPAATATTIAPPFGTTWTVDPGTNALKAYAPGASGTATPIATIAGAATGLASPRAVAVGSAGNVFVANSGNNSITEYRPGATNNAAPIATIKGSQTGLTAPDSITLVDGMIWTTDPATNVVEAFSAGSSGNELPAETIAGHKTLLNHPVGVAVANLGGSGSDGEVLAAVPGFGGVYVINAPTAGKGSVTIYSSGKLGDVSPDTVITSTKKHPLVSPSAIVSPGLGTLLVADEASNALSEMLVFPGISSVPVLRTISGVNTGLDKPDGLTINALEQIVVANAGNHSLKTFALNARDDATPIRTVTGIGGDAASPSAAAVFGAKPGAPTGLHVVVNRKALTATLSWQPPAVTGGGIAGYQVTMFGADDLGSGSGASSGIVNVIVSEGALGSLGGSGGLTRKTTVTRHLKLGQSYFFAVQAVNGFGQSGIIHPVIRTLAIAASPPQHVSATAGAHSIVVRWHAPKHDGGDPVTSYRVEYAACVPGAKGCSFHSIAAPRNRAFTTIRGLAGGTTYHVRVLAKTKHGPGKPSGAVTATTHSG
jgi:Fibronectin type III domain